MKYNQTNDSLLIEIICGVVVYKTTLKVPYVVISSPIRACVISLCNYLFVSLQGEGRI